MTNLTWECLSFEALDASKVYRVLKARFNVFVVEQNSIYDEIDGKDFKCRHLIASGPNNDIAAYLRVVPPGLKWPEASLGRILVTKPYRGIKLGRELVSRGLEEVRGAWPHVKIRIEAQIYLKSFYESFGFKQVSEPFDDGGIMHIEMLMERQ